MKHKNPSPFAGDFVFIKSGVPDLGDKILHVEDWWDRLTGKSWTVSDGNPAAMLYGLRVGMNGLPLNDEVVYGHIDHLGYLIHISEIDMIHHPEQGD